MSATSPNQAKPLSERAKLRLRLAAGLLRGEGMKIDCPRDAFYPTIQTVLAGLAAERQEALRALVDWLEEYETGAPIQAVASKKVS